MDEVQVDNKKIDEAVILLGGMGTRLLPYTKTVSKEMLPVYDVPAIFLLVKEAYLSGIKKIIFVVTEQNYQLIKNFFSQNKYLDNFLKDKPNKKELLNEVDNIINKMKFTYVMQKLKGTYGALYSAKDFIKNDNFIVMYGDDILASDTPITQELIKKYCHNNKMYVVVQETKDLPDNGIALLDNDNNLIDLVSKNKLNSKCVVYGRMLLNKKIFKIKNNLPKHDNDEYYLPYALLNYKDVEAYKYKGKCLL